MKKIIFALLVLMLAGTVTAANVTITVTPCPDNNGWARIDYTADANVRAFALDVVANGANIVDVNHYFEGECTATNKGFGIFLDSINGIDINDSGGVEDSGIPVAHASSAGAAGTGIGTDEVIIGMGALYEDGNQPPLSGKLCSFQVGPAPAYCHVSVTAEATYRGGVVLEDTNSVTPNVSGATDVLLRNCNSLSSYCVTCDFTGWGGTYTGVPDNNVDSSEIEYVIYFYGTTDCNATVSEPMCAKSDFTGKGGTYSGVRDNKVNSDEIEYIIYFYGNQCCN